MTFFVWNIPCSLDKLLPVLIPILSTHLIPFIASLLFPSLLLLPGHKSSYLNTMKIRGRSPHSHLSGYERASESTAEAERFAAPENKGRAVGLQWDAVPRAFSGRGLVGNKGDSLGNG